MISRCLTGRKARPVLTALAVLLLSTAAGAAVDDPVRPNIVFILVDDMGWTGLSAKMDDAIEDSGSDYYRTPRIDKLATQGMRFSRAYAPAALCTPSRASILTGQTPARVRITTPGRGGRPQAYQKLIGARQLSAFPSSAITAAEVLSKAGYATAHFGKWHLPGGSPGDHGFDVHDGATGNDTGDTEDAANPKDIFGLTERAIGFIESQAKESRPFYLHLSHYAVHSPTQSLETTKKEFEKRPDGERHSDAAYAAMTRDLDTGIGRLLDRLDELGLTKATCVVVMSDNGAAGGRRRPKENLPLRGGKGSLHEGGLRVPLIIRGPGIKANSTCGESVVGWDLLPTFCGWAGVPVPDGVEGSDLAPLLSGGTAEFKRAEPALLFHYPHYGQGPQVPQSALILGDLKLIKSYEGGTFELFDLAADLSEKKDLSTERPDVFARMKRELDRRLEETKAQLPTENPDYDPEATRPRKGRNGGSKKRAGRGRRK